MHVQRARVLPFQAGPNTQTLFAHNNKDRSQPVRISELIINLEAGTGVNVPETCRSVSSDQIEGLALVNQFPIEI